MGHQRNIQCTTEGENRTGSPADATHTPTRVATDSEGTAAYVANNRSLISVASEEDDMHEIVSEEELGLAGS